MARGYPIRRSRSRRFRDMANGGYPTGSCLVEAMLKEAEPTITRMPDPAKTKNLLCLDRKLLEFYASRVWAITIYTKR